MSYSARSCTISACFPMTIPDDPTSACHTHNTPDACHIHFCAMITLCLVSISLSRASHNFTTRGCRTVITNYYSPILITLHNTFLPQVHSYVRITACPSSEQICSSHDHFRGMQCRRPTKTHRRSTKTFIRVSMICRSVSNSKSLQA